MDSMHRGRCWCDAGLLVFATVLLYAASIEAQAPETPAAPPAARDSSVLAPPVTGDSSQAEGLTFVVDSLASAGPAEDVQGLADRLRRLTTAASGLPPDERLVFDEVVAAAREMLASGDLEAGRLLTADAIDVLRRGSP